MMNTASSHYYALGIDIGTNCGWALLKDEKIYASGVMQFPKNPFDATENGLRLRDFEEWLHKFKNVNDVFYEHNAGFQKSEKAIMLNYSMLGVIQKVCAVHEIRMCRVHTSTLKKVITGDGRADKERMGRVLEDMGWRQALWSPDGNLVNHDECDAVSLIIASMKSRGIQVRF